MIRVSSKDLEQVKNDPALFAANLVSKGKLQARRGMFSQWQTVARQLHVEDLSIAEASRQLTSLFTVWNDTPKNIDREASFHTALTRYDELFQKKGFTYFDGAHVMNWKLHNNVILGGYTPWIAKRSKEYFSYLFTENDFDWESELRFPLLQQYISTNLIDCDPQDLSVGIYCLNKGAFKFKSFKSAEIADAKSEVRVLFNRLNIEYTRKKISHN
jgi:hypothetical protein